MRALGRSEADDELSRWLAEGYAPAFRTALLLLGNRADAEEAVQDAFLRAWRFRSAAPGEDGIRPWLYRVVVNASLSKLRADGRRRAHITGLAADRPPPGAIEPPSDGPEAWAVDREEHRFLLAAVTALPDHLKVVVVLRYYAQLSEKEIAAVIRRRPGTVKSRLHEARTRLADDEGLLALNDRALVRDGGDPR